jgi:hypothetical protein
MIIKRDTTTTLLPRVYEELLKRQHRTYYNEHWELRKPIGIYNVTFNAILESFREVLDELDIVSEKQEFRKIPSAGIGWDTTLIRRQEDLNTRLMRYFDDCANLLYCFFPRMHVGMGSELDKDQKAVRKNPHIQAAWLAAKDYRTHIADIENHMKHYQGVLRGVVLFNEVSFIPGYFVEHINQQETIEPHPAIHKDLDNGMSTAFSFYRDLRYKLWLVYAVGQIVADAITQIEPTVTSYTDNRGNSEEIIKVFRRIAALPITLYQDEIAMNYPHIAVIEMHGVSTLYMEYPGKRMIPVPPKGPYKVAMSMVGDGITKSFAPPYFLGGTIDYYQQP